MTRPRAERGHQYDRPYLALLLLIVVAVFNHVDRTILSILQVPIKRDLDLSDAQLGALTGLSFAIVYCIFAVPMSRLADRTHRVRLITAALILWSCMTAASGLATGFWTLVVLRMGLALGESCCSPTTLSLISDHFPLRKRPLPIALWSMSVPVGTMVGISAGGLLGENFGWRAAFIAIGVCGLILAPMLLILREPQRGQHDQVAPEASTVPSLYSAASTLWRSPAFRWLLLAGTLQSYVLVSVQMWSAPFYVRTHGLSLSEAGFAVAVLFGLGGGLGALVGGLLSQRLAAKNFAWFGWLPAIACLSLIPFALAQFFARDISVSLGCGLIAAVLINAYLAPFNASTQSLVSANMRAFTSATILIFTNLVGVGLGPVVTGALSDYFTLDGAGRASTGMALSATVPIAFLAALAWWRAGNRLRAELKD